MKQIKITILGANAAPMVANVEGLDSIPTFEGEISDGSYLLKVADGEITLEEYTAPTIPTLPEIPEEDGTYQLVVSSGVASFVKVEEQEPEDQNPEDQSPEGQE